MNGVLNVLKPAGMTSFDVIGFLRRVTRQKKIGHTGTLDPSAVGVLPLCFGNATKAIEFMMDKDKVYRAELTLGSATDTQDSSGTVLYSNEVKASEGEIVNAVMSFLGEIEQLPPMYSAIKIGGKKLYELARQGETIEREKRSITIYDLNIIRIWDNKVLFDVHCSKGTYIRTLCNDIGEKLGCGGHMSFLVRTKAGKYDIASAITVEEIQDLAEKGSVSDVLQSVETVFEDYESIVLNDRDLGKYSNGVWIEFNNEDKNIKALYKIYDNKQNFIGIGELFEKEYVVYLKSKKFFG